MRMLPDCYACALRQALAASRLASNDKSLHYRCVTEALRILSDAGPEMTPPEVGEHIYRMVREFSGNPDPFKEQKKRQNEAARALLPWLRERVASAGDPLLTALRFSIAGNVVDPGAHESFELERTVVDAVEVEGPLGGYLLLQRSLLDAKTVLFIADNCGEIIFDEVLIEMILEAGVGEVVLAVRGGPIINDVTEAEALEIGLDRLCTVVSSGLEMPGTCIHRTPGYFQEMFESADVIISKGQGNWETLENSKRQVFFLFQAKCPSVASINGCDVGQPLLISSQRC